MCQIWFVLLAVNIEIMPDTQMEMVVVVSGKVTRILGWPTSTAFQIFHQNSKSKETYWRVKMSPDVSNLIKLLLYYSHNIFDPTSCLSTYLDFRFKRWQRYDLVGRGSSLQIIAQITEKTQDFNWRGKYTNCVNRCSLLSGYPCNSDKEYQC